MSFIKTSELDHLAERLLLRPRSKRRSLRFPERGQGPRLALDGDIGITGRIPIATRGGLKVRGHPVAATDVYQIVEIVQWFRGEAGKTRFQMPEWQWLRALEKVDRISFHIF